MKTTPRGEPAGKPEPPAAKKNVTAPPPTAKKGTIGNRPKSAPPVKKTAPNSPKGKKTETIAIGKRSVTSSATNPAAQVFTTVPSPKRGLTTTAKPTYSSKVAKATLAVVDFESYYDKDITLKKLGYYHYLRAEAPGMKAKDFIYMVSIVTDKWQWVGHPLEAPWQAIAGIPWLCWNAMMELHAEERLRELKIIPASCKPSQWIDVSQLAVYLGAPRNLEMAMGFFYGYKADKTMRNKAKGKTPAMLKAEGLWDGMKEYNLHDGQYPLRVWEEHNHKWPEWERRLGHLTIEKAMQGVMINESVVLASIKKLELMMWKARKALPWVEDADVAKGAVSPKGLAKACRDSGIPVPPSTAEDDPGCDEWEKTYGVKFGWVAQMRIHRKANILLKKCYFMRDRRLPSGRMRYSLKYFGGHTGRWSGDGGFNIQNPNKEAWEGIDLRSMIMAPKGMTLAMADLSQIEPRMLYWILGVVYGIQIYLDLLDSIAKGESIYEIHARNTMGWKGGNIKKENPKQQFLAKQRVLALGYGCGWEKFRNRCRELGFEITDDEAKAQVADFRKKEKDIVKLWGEMDAAFRKDAVSPEREHKYQLPSGRVMTYRNIIAVKSKVEGSDGLLHWRVNYTARTEAFGPQKKLYGGLLVENLIQAASRDVFATKLLALHDAGFNWTFHVHDEAIIELPTTDPKKVAKFVEQILAIIRAPVDWLPGCPLESEVVTGPCYTK